MSNTKKASLIILGIFFAILGTIGSFLPIMPGIPFFIAASICFSKGSDKFHNFLLHNKYIGPHIRNYHENGGITLKTKIIMSLLQFFWLGVSAVFFVHSALGRSLLALMGLGVVVFIFSIRTAKS